MDIVPLIISLVSGAVGGNVAGAAMKDKSLGALGNSLAGILGGGAGGAILQMMHLMEAGGTSPQAIISSIASGGVGGAVLLVIVSIIKGMMAGKA